MYYTYNWVYLINLLFRDWKIHSGNIAIPALTKVKEVADGSKWNGITQIVKD